MAVDWPGACGDELIPVAAPVGVAFEVVPAVVEVRW
jgi:hypothetical protein